MVDVGRLSSYRGEGVVFDISPVGIAGGFLQTDIVRFIAKRDVETADAAADVDLAATFADINTYRVVVPAAEVANFPSVIVELAWAVTWKRGSADAVILRAGDWWVYPSARMS